MAHLVIVYFTVLQSATILHSHQKHKREPISLPPLHAEAQKQGSKMKPLKPGAKVNPFSHVYLRYFVTAMKN
jgi:hypothetical protein